MHTEFLVRKGNSGHLLGREMGASSRPFENIYHIACLPSNKGDREDTRRVSVLMLENGETRRLTGNPCRRNSCLFMKT